MTSENAGSRITTSCTLGGTCARSKLSQFQPSKKWPSYRTRLQELQRSNPEIRRRNGSRFRVLTEPSSWMASNAPNHPQKRRKTLVLQVALQHVWSAFSSLKIGRWAFSLFHTNWILSQ